MQKKFYLVTTIPLSFIFFHKQPQLWRQAFKVCAISSNKKELNIFGQEEKIDVQYIPMVRDISLFRDIWCLLLFIILFIFKRPTIVHGNTPKASLLSMLAAWMTRVPHRIYMCHGLRYQGTNGILRNILMSMERISCFCATNVICVSEGVKKQLINDNICKAFKAQVIRYGTAGGINVKYFSRDSIRNIASIRDELNIPKSAFVFCFVGRIVKDKGINELLAAFDLLSKEKDNIHLLLVGPEENDLDPINSQSKAIIDTNKRVHALGQQKDVRPFLANSNAFVLPSYREGVGMVILEANAMGVPAIASDIIGCNDVVTTGVNGELTTPRDMMALYQKMKSWVENPKIVDSMAKKCREYVCSRYSSDDVAIAYFNEYKKIAGL